jgi:hypothetical protein
VRYSLIALIRGLTVPYAILLGAIVIGGAIAGAPLIAPYRFTGDARDMWRLNTVTGEGRLCRPAQDATKRIYMNCEH